MQGANPSSPWVAGVDKRTVVGRYTGWIRLHDIEVGYNRFCVRVFPNPLPCRAARRRNGKRGRHAGADRWISADEPGFFRNADIIGLRRRAIAGDWWRVTRTAPDRIRAGACALAANGATTPERGRPAAGGRRHTSRGLSRSLWRKARPRNWCGWRRWNRDSTRWPEVRVERWDCFN